MAQTEQADDRYCDIDLWPTEAILTAIVSAQTAALAAVAAALPMITIAADAIAAEVQAGGRLIYVGAGSSGLVAEIDAREMPGTFGLDPAQVPVLVAGGSPVIRQEAEDDGPAAEQALAALGVGPKDILVGLTASGTTPYVLAAVAAARLAGARTVGIACVAGAPLLAQVDHGILIATPPEVIAGSTRMNAGTAQKCVLNMLSTLLGIRLGHGFAGLMVNMRADNAKLRGRAVAIVSRAAGVDPALAAAALSEAGEIKPAILRAAGVADVAEARRHLAATGGNVRAALARAGLIIDRGSLSGPKE